MLSFSEAMDIIESVRDKVRYREPELTEIVEEAFKKGIQFAEEEKVNKIKTIKELPDSVINRLKLEYLKANPEEKDVTLERLYEVFTGAEFAINKKYAVAIFPV